MDQHEKIVALMIRRHGEQEWFKPNDFMNPALEVNSPFFVGYEAGARISELHKKYPDIIEPKKEGRYRMIRFRFENITTAVLDALPKNMSAQIRIELIRIGL